VLRKRGDVDCRQSIASTIRPPTLQACRRAASAAAAGQRVPSCQKGRGLQLRAWLIVGGASARLLGLKVCVCGPRSRPCGPAQAPPTGTGLAAVVRRLRPRCPEWAARPTTVVSSGVLVGLGGVCVATPWLVREPRGWGFRGCGGGGWGAAVWWAASWAQARGQLATETCTPGQCQWHAAARMPFKPDTASFRAVRCVVGGKEAKFSRSDVASASNLRNPLQMTCRACTFQRQSIVVTWQSKLLEIRSLR